MSLLLNGFHVVVRVLRRFILERLGSGSLRHFTPRKRSQCKTLHCDFFIGVVECGLVCLREQAIPLFVATEAESSHFLDVSQVLGGLLDGFEAAVIALIERVNLFALVLSIKVTDFVLLMGDQFLRLVFLDVEVCRVFVLHQVVVIHCHNCVVAG